MKALILAGGFATRLRPLSCTRPKSLLPILNKPLLQWIFERLAQNNIKEAVMAVDYRTEVAIKQQRIPRCGVHITYSRDPLRKPLGTGGAIRKAKNHIGHEPLFLVLNGDIFSNIDYAKIIKLHQEKRASATIALHQVEDPSRYGVADLASDSRIEKFIEKPPKGTAPTNLINAGVYVLSQEIFRYLPPNRKISIERDVFTKLAKEDTLYGYVDDNLWMDIGKPEDYLETNKLLLNSLRNLPKPATKNGIEIKMPVYFDKGVSISRRSTIGPYVILGRNVTVGNEAKILNSVVLRETEISDSVSIGGAIIGEGVFIGKHVKIGKGCILGDHVRVKDNTTLAKGVWVCPAKEVNESVLKPRFII